MDCSAVRDPFGARDDSQRLVHHAVGILEQTLFKLELQDARGRAVNPLLLHVAFLQAIHDAVRPVPHGVFADFFTMLDAASAEHVGTVLQGFVVQPTTRLLGQLHALVGDTGNLLTHAQRPPVGHDDAVEAKGVTQVAHGHGVPLDVGGIGDARAAAVGHDPFVAASQRSLPADHPVVEVLRHRAGIAEVGVAAAADPVLDARRESGVFHALNFLINDVRDVFGILAVLRADFVRVGLEGHMDTDRNHRLAVDVGELVRQFGVIGGAVGDVRLVDVAAPSVELTVRGENHRDAQAFLFRRSLQVVQRADDVVRRAVQVEQHTGQVEIRNQGARRFEIRADAEQQTRFFFGGHLADQVIHAGFGVQTPVLVGIKLSVLVHVLELVAVHFQNRGDTLDVSQAGLFAIGFNQGELARLRQQFRFCRALLRFFCQASH